jgi:hypothetical protein
VKREVVRELVAILALVLYMGTYVVLFLKLGWLGFWATTAMLTGSLLIMLAGLPKVLTGDINLPKDTRTRLGWDEPKNQP